MRKKLLALMLCMIVVVVSGCNMRNDNQINGDANIEKMQDDSLEKRITELKKEFPGQKLPETNIYINEECGYKFEFPEAWTGNYFINDDLPECAVVRFYGESIRGTVLEKTLSAEYDYGLKMFFILSEEAVNNGDYDSVTLIGNARGTNYYFATSTDVSLAPLLFGDGKFWFDKSESEQQLVNKDCEKLKEMMVFYDYESLDNLSKAFKEI